MESVAYGCVSASELSCGFAYGSFSSELNHAGTFNNSSPEFDERSRKCKLVRAVQRRRRGREAFFEGELFADPAWDMLLELYGSFLEQRRIAISSLCVAAHVPATTALRWICKLEHDGLAVRKDDPSDGRRSWIELTADAIDRMSRYFEKASDGLLAI